MIRHTSKVRDKIGLQKTEENDKQLLIEKIIARIENKTPYTTETEKETETMLEIEKKKKKTESADVFIRLYFMKQLKH